MYTIGIDLGGTNIAVGIVSENKIIRKLSTPTLANRKPEEIVKDMADLCYKLLDKEGLKLSDIEFCGICTPGIANDEAGRVEYASNLPFSLFPIVEVLKGYIPFEKVYIANDANAAAKGESECGSAAGSKSSVMITLGTGVGGGVIIDKKVYAGFNHAGGELGHTVIVANGRKCSCGRRGCWETYSSATGLILSTKEKMLETKDTLMWKMCDNDIEKVSGKTAFDAAKAGDKAGKEVVDEYIKMLGCGLVNIVNIFQPEVLSIGGGVCNEGDYILEPLKEIVYREQYSAENVPDTKIVIAKLGNDAGIIGAAMLGF
ncbi:MAG: ROK family protein [Clostridia bacterium]|nr:ROK family protein [Clostridia bacterium]